MVDFNFFDELMLKKKVKTSTSTYVAGVAFVLIIILGIVSYIYSKELEKLGSEKIALENKLNEGTHQQNYKEAMELRDEVSRIDTEKVELEQINGRLLDSRIIDNLLIKEIALAKPDALAITSINFSEEGINIVGTGINKDLIARFEHNLRANSRFSGFFIPMIEKIDKWHYSFTLNITFDHPTIISEEEVDANGQG